MANDVVLFKRQLIHDIKNGIVRRYKVYVLFMILLSVVLAFWDKRIALYTTDKAGLFDYLIYIFSGKEEITNLTVQDVFDIPIAWLFVHIYTLFSIGTYPKTEYVERGYQFLIRAGNKWCWWLSKCIYIFLSAILYYISLLFTCLVFTAINRGSYTVINREICMRILGVNHSEITDTKLFLCTVIMPILLFMALNFLCMLISFTNNNILAVIAMMGYLSVSAYWCSDFLLGNYTMLLRAQKMQFGTGITVSLLVIILSGALGYGYFKSLDIYSREEEV